MAACTGWAGSAHAFSRTPARRHSPLLARTLTAPEILQILGIIFSRYDNGERFTRSLQIVPPCHMSAAGFPTPSAACPAHSAVRWRSMMEFNYAWPYCNINSWVRFASLDVKIVASPTTGLGVLQWHRPSVGAGVVRRSRSRSPRTMFAPLRHVRDLCVGTLVWRLKQLSFLM